MNPLSTTRATTLTLGLIASTMSAMIPLLTAADQDTGSDMLRFANDDTLHGQFLAFNAEGNLLWQNQESPDPITFSTKKLHRIVLNNGQAHQSIEYKSAIHLINGDVIPGIITSADDSNVTLKTEHLGTITIDRNNITSLSTTPFGGKLFYYGPLNADGWKTSPALKPKSKPKKKDKTKDKEKPADTSKKEAAEKEEKKETDWKYTSNAWYSGSDKSSYLIREDALPDQCRLSFKLAWRGSLYANVVLHADFAPPEYTGDENARLTASSTPGHAYILSISAHSATLSSLTYDEETGKPRLNSLNDTRVSLALSNKSETDIELRIDRLNKSILIYSDGSFRGKWALGEHYEGKGNHLAFSRSPHYNNSEIKFSHIAISHWNGMKDSAQSMSTSKRDVILLNNGVDRFSGIFKNIRDGQVSFTGTYNNAMTIPLDEVAEIHLATSQQNPPPETAKEAVYFYVYPYGRITGAPSSSNNEKTKLKTILLDEVELDTSFINIIDFSHKNSLLDLWDDNF